MRLLYTFLVATITVTAASATPLFMGLGDLPGPIFNSRATAISDDGSVVVGYADVNDTFRWTEATGMIALAPTFITSAAYDVSADGSVIVGSVRQTITSSHVPVRWTPTLEFLGDLPGGPIGGNATAVSGDGSTVVGGSSGTTGNQAFRWTASTGMVGLGDLPGGFSSSFAWGISSDGKVIVGDSSSSLRVEAFRWSLETGMVGLGALSGSSLPGSIARSVSADGSVIVGLAYLSGTSWEAFRWTAAGGMVGLGDLPGGSHQSAAAAVSGDGSIVVGNASTIDPSSVAFIWDSIRGLRNLNEVLVNDFGLDLTGWTLRSATISADGLKFAGMGSNPSGQDEAWLAIIPEPSTALLLASGLGALALRRRRQRAA